VASSQAPLRRPPGGGLRHGRGRRRIPEPGSNPPYDLGLKTTIWGPGWRKSGASIADDFVSNGSASTRAPEFATFPGVRRWFVAMTVGVFALLPVGLAISASPGHGKGCKKNRDGTFHGYCVHHKTVTKTHTKTVRRTHTATQTATEDVTSQSTTTVGGSTVTTTSTAPATTRTTTTTPSTTTTFSYRVASSTASGTASSDTVTQTTGTVTSTRTVYTTTTATP
jgi:hypothetical protein